MRKSFDSAILEKINGNRLDGFDNFVGDNKAYSSNFHPKERIIDDYLYSVIFNNLSTNYFYVLDDIRTQISDKKKELLDKTVGLKQELIQEMTKPKKDKYIKDNENIYYILKDLKTGKLPREEVVHEMEELLNALSKDGYLRKDAISYFVNLVKENGYEVIFNSVKPKEYNHYFSQKSGNDFISFSDVIALACTRVTAKKLLSEKQIELANLDNSAFNDCLRNCLNNYQKNSINLLNHSFYIGCQNEGKINEYKKIIQNSKKTIDNYDYRIDNDNALWHDIVRATFYEYILKKGFITNDLSNFTSYCIRFNKLTDFGEMDWGERHNYSKETYQQMIEFRRNFEEAVTINDLTEDIIYNHFLETLLSLNIKKPENKLKK